MGDFVDAGAAARPHAWNLKTEMQKLVSGSHDVIELDFGSTSIRPVSVDSMLHNGGGADARTCQQQPSGRILYEDMRNLVEDVLHEHG